MVTTMYTIGELPGNIFVNITILGVVDIVTAAIISWSSNTFGNQYYF